LVKNNFYKFENKKHFTIINKPIGEIVDKKDYNDYLTNLFMQCSLKAYEFEYTGERHMASPEKMFRETASAFNRSIASGFLKELDLAHPSIEAKVNNYPERFWHTSEAKDAIREGFNNLIKKDLSEKLQNLYELYYFSVAPNTESDIRGKVNDSIEQVQGEIKSSFKSILKAMQFAAERLEALNPENKALYIIADNIRNIVEPIAQIQKTAEKDIDVSAITDCFDKNSEFGSAMDHMVNSFIRDKFGDSRLRPTKRM
jgi:hypothetical protein